MPTASRLVHRLRTPVGYSRQEDEQTWTQAHSRSHYSQTGQTRTSRDHRRGARNARHQVDTARLTPVEDFRFPWSVFALISLMVKTYAGVKLRAVLEDLPPHIRSASYEIVVIGHQPWFLAPSVPVLSFLDGPTGELLRGRKVVSVITCREHWKRGFRIFEEMVSARGGTVVDSLVVRDPAPRWSTR
jgi:hypothetical protein